VRNTDCRELIGKVRKSEGSCKRRERRGEINERKGVLMVM